MFKLLSYIAILFFMLGCGADSDLLKDASASSATKPKGLSAQIMQNGIYQYTRIDDQRVGLTFIGVNGECSTTECYMIEEHYVLFDNNITNIDTNSTKQVVFSPYGWQEQAAHHECNLIFNHANMTERCPNGQEKSFSFIRDNVSDSKLSDVYPQVISENLLKDPYARFATNTFRIDITQALSDEPYSISLNENSKCFMDINMTKPATSTAFETYASLYCSVEEYILALKNLDLETGTVEVFKDFLPITDVTVLTWNKETLLDTYEIIEIAVSDELKTMLSLENDLFISYYNAEVRYGHKRQKKEEVSYLDKIAFDNIYSQLKEEYKGKSIIAEFLKNSIYEVGIFADKIGYKTYFLNDAKNNIKMQYDAFFEVPPTPNWILNTQGLNRESTECDIAISYDRYRVSCDDGRENIYKFLGQRNLKEEFIFQYLKDNDISIGIENSTTLFSVKTEEIRLQKESLNASYMFNLDSSLSVGETIGSDNASSLFGRTLYVASKDKKNYIKVISPSQNSKGTAEFYIKSVLQDNNTTWSSGKIGGIDIVKIILPDNMKKYFHTNDNLILVEKVFDSKKIVTGRLLDNTQTKPVFNLLNYEGYKDIESLANNTEEEKDNDEEGTISRP